MGKERIQAKIIVEIFEERKAQDEKWGEQNHDNLYWLGILMEEVGEVAKALIEKDFKHARVELVQCMAVCMGWLECIDRKN